MKQVILPRINDRSCQTTTTEKFYILRGVGPASTILYTAFVDDGISASAVSDDITWESSDTSIATVANGVVTRVANGTAIIKATRNSQVAYASITLSNDPDFCDATTACTVIVIDRSQSMSAQVDLKYATGLDTAKIVALGLIAALNAKDYMAIETFDGAPVMAELPTHDKTVLGATVQHIGRMVHHAGTDMRHALRKAVGLFGRLSITVTQPVIVLITDGKANPEHGSADLGDVLDLATSFKDQGGIIICAGMNASGAGYLLLRDIATDGYFFNVTPISGSAADAIASITTLASFYCAG